MRMLETEFRPVEGQGFREMLFPVRPVMIPWVFVIAVFYFFFNQEPIEIAVRFDKKVIFSAVHVNAGTGISLLDQGKKIIGPAERVLAINSDHLLTKFRIVPVYKPAKAESSRVRRG